MKGSSTSPPSFGWDDWYASVGGRSIHLAEVDGKDHLGIDRYKVDTDRCFPYFLAHNSFSISCQYVFIITKNGYCSFYCPGQYMDQNPLLQERALYHHA